jgi:phosphatidate cytidylyltransferase
MVEADFFLQTMWTVAGVFVGGAVLALVLAKFNIERLMKGELGQRYLGWLLLMPFYTLIIFSPVVISASFLALVMALMVYEYGRASDLRRPDLILLVVAAIMTLGFALWSPWIVGALPMAILLLLTLLPILQNRPELMHNQVHLVSWGYIYTIWTVVHAVLMLQQPYGKGWLVVVIVGCALSDVGAYVAGKALGKRLIAPLVSPTKCWEGLIGDIAGASIAVALLSFGLPNLPWYHLLLLILLIGLGSAWGDLISSLSKRISGIKDWGTLIPGHGGVLDRLNSLLIVMPLVYYYSHLAFS